MPLPPDALRVLPDLKRLHERHHALNPEVNASYAQAAAVSFSRHHTPSITLTVTCDDESDTECSTTWDQPDDRTRDAWNNEDDATRDGAYAVALAAVEMTHEFFAVARAEVRTGADYYVGPAGSPSDLEDVHRLEISGIDRGGESALRKRLEQKLDQTDAPDLNGPALACVVAFRLRRVAIARLT